MYKIVNLFRTCPAYFWLVFAALVSSIGKGLTQVAVYGQLAKSGASPTLFTVAFAFSVIPAFFCSHLAIYLMKRIGLANLLGWTAVAGAFGLVPVLIGSNHGNLWLLLSAEFIGASVAAVTFPVIQVVIKRHFSGEYLISALKLDSALFSIQVILGIGVGTLLFDRFSSFQYISIDLISYLVAAGVLFCISRLSKMRLGPEVDETATQVKTFAWKGRLTGSQKRALLLFPALTFIGTPATALLPTLGQRFSGSSLDQTLGYTPALLFLLSKCLGQMSGPFLVRDAILKKENPERIYWSLLAVFCGLYVLASVCTLLWISLVLIFIAHVCSNIVYALSSYQMQTSFSEEQIGQVSSGVFRHQIIIMTVVFLFM